MTQGQKLEVFTDVLFQLDKQDLEGMLIQLAWKETTIEKIVDSVVEDHLENN